MQKMHEETVEAINIEYGNIEDSNIEFEHRTRGQTGPRKLDV